MAMTPWFPTKLARQIVARIEVTDTKNLGRTPLLMPLLGMLGLRQAIDQRQPSPPGQKLSDGEVLEALTAHIVNSLGGRRVPFYKLEEWMGRSGLASFYGVPSTCFNDDRFDRALDRFLPQAKAVVREVSSNLISQFHPVVGAIHHDLTYVLLYGAYEGSSLVTYGYNAKGAAQKQVNVELDVLGPEGWVVNGAPLSGRENGCHSFASMVAESMELLGGEEHTVVADRMFGDYLRLWGLKAHHHHFVVPVDAQRLPPGYLQSLPDEEFEVVSYHSEHDPQNTYRAAHRQLTLKAPQGVSTPPLTVEALIVWSERKAQDDREGREKAIRKVEKRLEEIQGHLNQRQYARREFAAQQIHKAMKPPFGRYLSYELRGEDKHLELEFQRNEPLLQEREKLDGKYVLVTDFTTPEEMEALFSHGASTAPPAASTAPTAASIASTAHEREGEGEAQDPPGAKKERAEASSESREKWWRERVLRLHKEQHLIESRNRNYKSDLVLHPVWLQKDTRIEALLYIYILALMLYSLLEVLYRRSTGERWTGRRILEAFGDYYAHRVEVIGEGAAWVLSAPSTEQRSLLGCLGLGMPAATFARL